jgi:hypothetical protein
MSEGVMTAMRNVHLASDFMAIIKKKMGAGAVDIFCGDGS